MVETIVNIAWLGGLLEGEGYFVINSKKKYPRIGIEMTSEDVIARVAAMWDSRVTRHRNLYVTNVNGFRAIRWMMSLLPFLGKCRKEKIASIIKIWKETTYVSACDGTRRKPTCHPDRLMEAHDLCKVCYDRERRKKDKQTLRKVG